MQPTDDALLELDHIAEHIGALRRLLLAKPSRSRKKSREADAVFDQLVREISVKWKGPDAVMEIRQQREKDD